MGAVDCCFQSASATALSVSKGTCSPIPWLTITAMRAVREPGVDAVREAGAHGASTIGCAP